MKRPRLGRLKSLHNRRRTMPRRSRTRHVRRAGRSLYRRARRSFSRGGRGNSIMSQTWNGLKDGIAYGTVAGRFAPQLAPIAELYGNWKGGGLIGLAINQLIVNPLLGRPSALGGLGLNLGNILPRLGGGSTTGQSGGMMEAV